MKLLGWLRSRDRWTVRVRLTLVYGVLFLVVGAGMLTLVYFLFPASGSTLVSVGRHSYEVSTLRVASAGSIVMKGPRSVTGTTRARTVTAFVALAQPPSGLHHLLVELGLALVPMTLVALALGWVIAGRALRPLRTITQAAQAISARNLHERLASTGPHDELRELSDTFDGLLARLQASFESHRRFMHHASHELRTPITRQRTVVEVALGDPDASVASLREMAARVLATSEEQERLIDGLLTLARSDELSSPPEPVDLAATAAEVLGLRASSIALRQLDLTTVLEPAVIAGDRALVERLVANLVDNAIEHNLDNGSITLTVGPTSEGARLTVANSGRSVSSDEVEDLLRPLEHRHDDGSRARQHHGLGLAIVQAVASVHGASLGLSPLAAGGLEVAVEFVRWPGRRGPVASPHARAGAERNGGGDVAPRHDAASR